MQIKNTAKGCLALSHSAPQALDQAWFNESFWRQQQAIVGSSKGRYTTWFVEHEKQQWVLRHYWRGGLMEKFSKDAYLFTGFTKTRAVAELALLEQLFEEGLPVPEPIAAKVERFGLWYRADILIRRIHGAEDLVALLQKQAMSRPQWQQLGALIGRFHQHGVYHADLNAKNILSSDQGFYLIDFDRGELRTPADGWQQANLSRLLRSFNKEKRKQPELQFTEENWQWLLEGYRGSASA
ncbi:3-deoxy-D-manno-octulosonic acid kinase [Shewanella algae]|uniref:3-deoxy-D-manno-octulosonic acid kinase n=1 Tax=Shewanella algae TaxID=38313 RepID=UPI00118231BB|nr:3-deoxy-D-manno-octulosonic acid kinase [Shewanella algae]TVL43779.1 3-deoxy-D-manno-octulosonic acid kinase [Shewanella algae]